MSASNHNPPRRRRPPASSPRAGDASRPGNQRPIPGIDRARAADDGLGSATEEIAWKMKANSAVPFASSHRERREERLRRHVRLLEARLRHERTLRERERLDALAVMAAGLAHDLNNRLMRIQGHAEIAAMAGRGGNSPEESLAEIVAAASEAAELCRRLLSFSGQVPMRAEDLDLDDLVRQELDRLQTMLEPGVRLELRLEPANIQADAEMIQRLIADLVANAAEATGTSGTSVEIRTGTALCSPEFLAATRHTGRLEPGRYAYVEVRDDGPGIETSVLEHLFDPFASTNFLGRGMGLAAVFGVVRQHRGCLVVDSEPGHGARVRAMLPMQQPTEARQLDLFGD